MYPDQGRPDGGEDEEWACVYTYTGTGTCAVQDVSMGARMRMSVGMGQGIDLRCPMSEPLHRSRKMNDSTTSASLTPVPRASRRCVMDRRLNNLRSG